MKNIFNIKRFGNYLLYDLNRLRGNFLISGIVSGLTPVMVFAIIQIFALIFRGQVNDVMQGFYVLLAGVATFFAIIASYPVKQYGSLTDRRFGSDFIMIPASTLEKTLSILIISMLVVPISVCAIFLGSDFFMSLMFGDIYGDSLFTIIGKVSEAFAGQDFVKVQIFGLGYISLCANILIFVLGAICFKRAKFVLTLLIVWAASILLGGTFVSIANGTILNIFNLCELNSVGLLNSADDIVRRVNIYLNVHNLILFLGLSTGIYFRLKTIKK